MSDTVEILEFSFKTCFGMMQKPETFIKFKSPNVPKLETFVKFRTRF